MSSDQKKTVTLRSSDNATFKVEESVMLQSQTIKFLMEDICNNKDAIIPLQNVDGKTLAKVIELCNNHADPESVSKDDDMATWDEKFVENFDQMNLFEMVMAANYLNIPSLLNLTCQKIADMMIGKKPEEICEMFNIINDFTPEEEEQVRRENQWAFDE